MLMIWAQVVLLLLLAAFATASFVVSRKPDARAVLAKMAPYQGIVGLAALGWGVVLVFRLVADLGALLASPLNLGIVLTAIVVHLALGLMMGLGLVRGFCSEQLAANLDRWAAKLAPFQVTLGCFALALAVLTVLRTLVM